jgi:hypothetical protein
MASDGIFKRCGCRDTAGRRVGEGLPPGWPNGAMAAGIPRLGAKPAGPPGTRPARRVPVARRGAAGPERVAGHHRGGPHGPVMDGGAMAAVLAVHPHRHPPDHPVQYSRDVERVLIPHLGRLCLADLDARRLRGRHVGGRCVGRSRWSGHPATLVVRQPDDDASGTGWAMRYA